MINNKGKDMQNLTDTLMGLTISELTQVQETIKQIKTMKAKSTLTVGGTISQTAGNIYNAANLVSGGQGTFGAGISVTGVATVTTNVWAGNNLDVNHSSARKLSEILPTPRGYKTIFLIFLPMVNLHLDLTQWIIICFI